MSFSQLIKIVQGRWKILAAVVLAVFGLALLVSLVLPKQYEAFASVIVDVKSPQMASDIRSAAQPSQQSVIQTQVELIRSERVARRVVALIKLDRQPQLFRQWQDDTDGKGDFINYIALSLLRKLDVVPYKDSSIIGIKFSAHNPDFAALIANGFAQAYIDVNLELKVDPARQTAGWFDDQRKAIELQLVRAQQSISKFQKDNGMLSVNEGQIDIENAKLANLSIQLSELQGQRADANSRQRQTEHIDTSADVLNNPVVSSIRGDISKAEANVKQMSAELGSGHPKLVAANEELKALKVQLATEMSSVAKTMGGASSVTQRKQAEIWAALNDQKIKVLTMKAKVDELAVLKREVDRSLKSLDVIEAQQSQATLESRMQQANVSFVTTAVSPTDSARPRIFLNLLLGTVFGVVLGLGVVLALEFREPIIRDAEDLASLLDLPILATVFHMSDKSGVLLEQQGSRPLRIGFGDV
jgi:chain length determinant protein EpsF